MRVTTGAAAITMALTMSACEQKAGTPNGPASNDLELGTIEAAARELNENTVTVDLRWTVRQAASSPIRVADLPPVFLSNGQSEIRAVPEAGLPNRDNGQVYFEASVNVSKEAWREGCWQVDYRIVGVVTSGPVTCVNQGA